MSEHRPPRPLTAVDPPRLGPYRLLGKLGQGGMGTVYLAEDTTGRRVAVKVINPDLAHDEAFRERFRREAEAARRVRRFCTAAVLDAHVTEDPLYVVTEYVPGPNLVEAVRADGPLRDGDVEALAVGVATALSAIHAAGIVHRDLKPANVLLSPLGPRVIDFGVARSVDVDTQLTRTGTAMGTPAYMAPEVLRHEPVTPASDMFCWGCVVVFAATGQGPFTGENIAQVMHRILHEPPQLDGLGDSLRRVVARTLAKNPANRPTAEQVLTELLGRTHADTELVVERLAAARKRRAPSRRMSLALVLAVLTGAGAYTWASAEEAAPRPLLTPPPVTRYAVPPDGFDNPGSGWTNVPHSNYKGGAYNLATFGKYLAYTAWSSALPLLPQRQLVSVTAQIKGGAGQAAAGVFCWGKSTADGLVSYEFQMARDGRVKIVRNSAGWSAVLADRTTTAPGSRSVRLQALCSRERLALWVDGRKAAEYTVNEALPVQETSGISGLLVSRPQPDAPNTEAVFDDFSVAEV
ncbi:serine/threonine-protein kinase [Actinomadura hibisca]|uniref:serine/threonine-protein kinase n=1 Tax=Actinomadura hibisca TaxID=68565 RepID=UPI0012FA7921|nr:serine/threonine-protein kinase [Actinomadura hibisca]